MLLFFIQPDHSLEHIRVGLGQVHNHLPEEGVGPSEPIPGNLRRIIHRERLVHEVVLGRLHQTLKAVPDLIVGLGGQDLNGESQRPDVSLICMRTTNSVYLSSRVEVFVLLGKDELPGV